MIALHGRDKPRGSSALVGDSVTVVLGGVVGGVAHGAKVGARIMYIDAFSPTPLFLLYATSVHLVNNIVLSLPASPSPQCAPSVAGVLSPIVRRAPVTPPSSRRPAVLPSSRHPPVVPPSSRRPAVLPSSRRPPVVPPAS